MTQVELKSMNCHIAAMCETTRPILCERHLAEVRQDGDVLREYGESAGPCTMCEAERTIVVDDHYEDEDGVTRTRPLKVRLDD